MLKNIVYIPGFGHCQLRATIGLVPESAHYCGNEYGENDWEYMIYASQDSQTFYAVLD